MSSNTKRGFGGGDLGTGTKYFEGIWGQAQSTLTANQPKESLPVPVLREPKESLPVPVLRFDCKSAEGVYA
ncbi:hypothetical protein N9D23_12505, partial [Rubripirellula sp.]|nr:hypothetical protein [Rubripirellula sp.]